MHNYRKASQLILITVALIVAGYFGLGSARIAFAQSQSGEDGGGGSLIYLPLVMDGQADGSADSQGVLDADVDAAKAPFRPAPLNLIVDTDPGVDDATALIWLFSQTTTPVHVLGIVSVAGNASIADTTRNAAILLEKLKPMIDEDKVPPVIRGAEQPYSRKLTKTTYFLHGPDGLWFQGMYYSPQPDTSGFETDFVNYYCDTIVKNPGVTILALGPLTNIAKAYENCPEAWASVRLVVLGGAKFGGNHTPVTEFNFWQDPEAAEIVFSNLHVSYVPLDTFRVVTVDLKDVEKLKDKGNPAARFLEPALYQYVDALIKNTGQATIPDAVAAVYALDASVATSVSALVKVMPGELLDDGKRQYTIASGQSIVGLTNAERLGMIADDDTLSSLAERFFYGNDPSFDLEDLQMELGMILYSEPDNALMATAIDRKLLVKTVLPALRQH